MITDISMQTCLRRKQIILAQRVSLLWIGQQTKSYFWTTHSKTCPVLLLLALAQEKNAVPSELGDGQGAMAPSDFGQYIMKTSPSEDLVFLAPTILKLSLRLLNAVQ